MLAASVASSETSRKGSEGSKGFRGVKRVWRGQKGSEGSMLSMNPFWTRTLLNIHFHSKPTGSRPKRLQRVSIAIRSNTSSTMIPAQSRRLEINFVRPHITEWTTCSCSARLLPRSGFLIIFKAIERVVAYRFIRVT